MFFKSKVNDFYTLNIKDIPFWKKVENDEGEFVYEKTKFNDSYVLFLDKFRNMEGVPNSCFECFDLITGRICALQDMGDNYLVLPSKILIPKSAFVKNNYRDLISKSMEILFDSGLSFEYTNISDGFLFDSYFCNAISERENIDVVPLGMFSVENESIKKKYKSIQLGVKNDR